MGLTWPRLVLPVRVVLHQRAPAQRALAPDLGFGRILASEQEVPNMLVDMV